MSEWGKTRSWLQGIGFAARDEALWVEALTHGSLGESRDYQRLEFLGDRVLGLTIAEWLFETQTDAAEGALAQRLNALVSKQACAGVARKIGVPEHVRLGRQARDDGAAGSDNILGDVMESLLGAQMREAGFDDAKTLVRMPGARNIRSPRCRNGRRAIAGARPNTRWSTVPAPITPHASPCGFR